MLGSGKVLKPGVKLLFELIHEAVVLADSGSETHDSGFWTFSFL